MSTKTKPRRYPPMEVGAALGLAQATINQGLAGAETQGYPQLLQRIADLEGVLDAATELLAEADKTVTAAKKLKPDDSKAVFKHVMDRGRREQPKLDKLRKAVGVCGG